MSDEFDEARVGIQLDHAEQAGMTDTDVAELLRELVCNAVLSRSLMKVTSKSVREALAEYALAGYVASLPPDPPAEG